eukprot:gb/GECG01009508.1/.p1 GENE.gb/GECG01009508.1/~~gb/GECG01009508.1/.p1  ORF type:complete len:297 (+),score=39.13 gb/GECG01009508.1/:1-891(+)
MFNDYHAVAFQNETVQYENGEMVSPFVARVGCESLAPKCHDLDPNNSTRPARDGAWVRKHSCLIPQIFTDYRKSGQQDAQDSYAEWLKFASNYATVYIYAIVLLPFGVMDQLGKALPEAQRRDTGKLGKRQLSNSASAVNKRRQRERLNKLPNKQRQGSSGIARKSQCSAGNTSERTRLSTILQAALEHQHRESKQERAMTFMFKHGDSDTKAKVMEYMQKAAFSPTPTPLAVPPQESPSCTIRAAETSEEEECSSQGLSLQGEDNDECLAQSLSLHETPGTDQESFQSLGNDISK